MKLPDNAVLIDSEFELSAGTGENSADFHSGRSTQSERGGRHAVGGDVRLRRPISSLSAVLLMEKQGVALSVNARKEPYANLENCVAVLRGHPRFAGRIWYDTFHQDILTTWDCETPRRWVDADRLRVAEVFQRDFGLVKFGDDLVEKAAITVAHEDQRDELCDWLTSLSWDGASRLGTWLQHVVGAPDDAYHAAVGRNFILSMVVRGMRPGCKVDTMPVFEGAQGAGKLNRPGITRHPRAS